MMSANRELPVLVMRDIRKQFAGVHALRGARLTVERGEVHALVGQNGAGKSTLIKILTGAYRRDAGEILFDGRPVDFHIPLQAQRAGISTIYQELTLIPFRSVAENIFLGREPLRHGRLIDWPRIHRDAEALLTRFGIELDVRRPLHLCNTATQQMVAIARAVSLQARLVIMDEPTSSLDEQEVETLFGVIRQLKADGVSVIYVSHRLDELYAVCDRITVMRDGATVAEKSMKDMGKLELVSCMLGRELAVINRRRVDEHRAARGGAAVLSVNGVSSGIRLQNANLALHAGEIVGLAGLLGAGRTELARCVFGADSVDGGEIRLNETRTNWRSPADAIARGVAYLPEDRKSEGIIPDMSVQENLTLVLLPRLARLGVVDTRRQQQVVQRFIDRLGIKTAGPDQKIRELSGGNQQKVLLARWLCANVQLLLLDEPTRGIDVGAKAEILSLIRELANDGLAVLVIASELEELVAAAERIVVLRDGRTVAELTDGNVNESAVMAVMAHGTEAHGPSGNE